MPRKNVDNVWYLGANVHVHCIQFDSCIVNHLYLKQLHLYISIIGYMASLIMESQALMLH